MRLQTGFIASAILAASASGAPTCRDVTIPVTISATNVQVPSTLTLASLTSFFGLGLANLVNVPAAGTYNIFGRYCEPEVTVSGNKDVLQILSHGIARDHHYWNAYDFDGIPIGGSNYSWVARSSLQGYPTLAIDRLGFGKSSRPDPFKVVQMPAQVEVIHQIIQQINGGFLGRKFSELVYVGHSYGSLVGQLFTAKYPQDVKRVILTGWASVNFLQLSYVASKQAPASQVDPARFNSLPSGYMLTTNQTEDSRSTLYQYGTPSAGRYFDQQFGPKGFTNRDTSTNGEAFTIAFTLTQPTQFTGRVFVATGKNDSFWCGNPGNAYCGSGASSVIAQGKNTYPNAKSYDYVDPDNTGHELLGHFTQNQTYDAVFRWLKRTA